MQLSAAQWKAYNAAYNAAAKAGFAKLAAQNRALAATRQAAIQAQNRQRAIQAAAQGLRTGRLKAVATIQAKVAVAHAAARTAAIARYAVSQSSRQATLAHQNKALQARVHADYIRHAQAAARMQFRYKGEKAFLHQAVMSTLTTAQATAIENAAFAVAAKAVKAASASTTQTGAAKATTTGRSSSPAVAAILANAKAAGLKAARATPKGRTAPRPAHLGKRHVTWQWQGDPEGTDCVAAAIANSLWHDGHELGPLDYQVLVTRLGDAPSIEAALEKASRDTFTARSVLAHYERADPGLPVSGLVIGFEALTGPHAALDLNDGLIASWGEVVRLEDVAAPGAQIEECWNLYWVRV